MNRSPAHVVTLAVPERQGERLMNAEAGGPDFKARDARVAVLAVDAAEAQRLRDVLARQRVASVACHRGADLARLLAEGLGAAVIDADALDRAGLAAVLAGLRHQPNWSDVPLVVLTDGQIGMSGRLGPHEALAALESAGHLTVLERPVAINTLLSTVQSALRTRRRQYEMRRLLRELQEGVAQRDHLLSMLGHELRNPLAAIRATTELLIRQEPSREPSEADRVLRRHHLELISRQGGQLVRMVDDLLDLGRLRSGRIRLQRVPLDLNEIVRRCVEAAEPAAGQRAQKIVASYARESAVVDGDPVRLEQAMSNLLANAMKYSAEGGTITLEVSTDGVSEGGRGGSATVRIVDSGVGMSPEVMRGVFDLFTQADQSIDRPLGGLGLGLPLVQSLIEGHGGTVSAASKGPGRGSLFTVRLPQSAAHAKPTSKATTCPEPQAVSRHVLLVEDQGDMRNVMARLLRSWGHHVETAATGPAGIETALAGRPEVALVDVGLPGLSGYEVASRLRLALDGNIRLIALTGYGAPEDRLRSAAAGFDLHLVKPVDFDQLRALLAE